ncbi:MAG: Smr/MutS family protein [Bacteroidales bacterium]|nr:Smr/MutS family protein [Bacteroidales bacterium]
MTNSRIEEKLGFDKVRTLISNACGSHYAAMRCEEENFSTSAEDIRHRLALTDEMRLILMFEDSFPTSGYLDTLDFLRPLESDNYSLDLQNLRKMRTFVDTLRKVTGFFNEDRCAIYPLLGAMSSSVFSFPEVLRRIDLILDRYGEVRDNASSELASIRKNLKDAEASISKRAAAVLRQYQADGIIDKDATISIRDGKLLLPVANTYKNKVQGFVYDASASGKTVFVEPGEVVELENRITELHFAEEREILRILIEFSTFVRPYVKEMIKSAIFLGEIDFIKAKAHVALDFIAGMPIISEDAHPRIDLRKARHPLLEAALRKEKKQIVPLTLSLNPAKHILLISGPNAGGKSVCLKTMGLLQYMFQWGMLIPTSETSEMMVFDRILVSIGDDQSLENDLSTYSSFLQDMKTMLREADNRTLVLIDEFGSGTEPTAGGAIAEAILAELDSRGTYGVITTHYSNLKMYASKPECGVVNGAMMFDSAAIRPMFKMEMGLPGNSFAFEMARKIGLSEEIVKDAEKRAGDDFVDIERNLRKIARSRKALDEKLQRVKTADKTLENITDQYQKELLEIKQLRKKIIDEATAQAQQIISSSRAQVENTIRTIKEAQAEKEATKEARAELQGFMSALISQKGTASSEDVDRKIARIDARKARQAERKAERAAVAGEKKAAEQLAAEKREKEFRNAPLAVGEKVRDKQSGMVGEVIKLGEKSIIVSLGNFTSKVPASRLERISSNEFRTASRDTAPKTKTDVKIDSGIQERKQNFKTELDVRGVRLYDALDEVSRYIDDAIMLSVGSVRIIHGKGTGVLHDEIQKMLRATPGVASATDEHIQFGGSGVTIVTLE